MKMELEIFSFGLNETNSLDSLLSALGDLSKYLLILAMSAIGLNVSFSFVLDKGLSVISVASIAFLMQIAFCILLMGYFVWIEKKNSYILNREFIILKYYQEGGDFD